MRGGLYFMFLGPPLRSFWIRYCGRTCLCHYHLNPAQDRSPFCIFHIIKGSQHPELMDTFLFGNHCLFLGRLSNEMQ